MYCVCIHLFILIPKKSLKKNNTNSVLISVFVLFPFGGDGGIRTHVPLAWQHDFESRSLWPLRYVSIAQRNSNTKRWFWQVLRNLFFKIKLSAVKNHFSSYLFVLFFCVFACFRSVFFLVSRFSRFPRRFCGVLNEKKFLTLKNKS